MKIPYSLSTCSLSAPHGSQSAQTLFILYYIILYYNHQHYTVQITILRPTTIHHHRHHNTSYNACIHYMHHCSRKNKYFKLIKDLWGCRPNSNYLPTSIMLGESITHPWHQWEVGEGMCPAGCQDCVQTTEDHDTVISAGEEEDPPWEPERSMKCHAKIVN